MTREDTVRVRVKNGGAASFAAGEKYALSIGAGQTAEKWSPPSLMAGSPITAAEFHAVLEREEIFEVVEVIAAEPETLTAQDAERS